MLTFVLLDYQKIKQLFLEDQIVQNVKKKLFGMIIFLSFHLFYLGVNAENVIKRFLSGIFFITIFLYTNSYFDFVLINLILILFLIIFFIDLKHFIIPDLLNFSLIFLGLLKNFIPTKNLNFNYDIEQSIIGGVVGYLTIWIIIFLYKKLKNLDAMGLGDAKLMAAIGTFFGLKSIPLILFLSSIIALLIVLPSLVNKTRNLKAEIPFGPYILISAGFYYFYGDKIYEILFI